jgi:hypothetical protein
MFIRAYKFNAGQFAKAISSKMICNHGSHLVCSQSDISGWNVARAENFFEMFMDAQEFNQGKVKGILFGSLELF